MVKNASEIPNAMALVRSFLKGTYVYTSVLNFTQDECHLIQYDTDYVQSFPEKVTFDYVREHVETYVHPMFIQLFLETFSDEAFKKSTETDTRISLEFLHFFYGDRQYHWITAIATPVNNNSGDSMFLFTAECTDKQNSDRQRMNEALFNSQVVNFLIRNYVLVYVVDLDNKMSRLVHFRQGDKYELYAKSFTSHQDMMMDACVKFVEPTFRKDFLKYTDYSFVKEQFDLGKDRLIHVFRDNHNQAFELTIFKYTTYSPQSPLVVYALKELI